MNTKVLQGNALRDSLSFPPEVFFASIKERYCLNPQSTKKTYHLVIDLAGCPLDYSVGDCLGIYPQNDSSYVDSILKKLNISADSQIKNRAGKTLTVKDFFVNQVNLHRIPKKLGGADFLEYIPSLSLDLQALCDLFLPMLPRYYSIASSQNVVGKEAHLTVELTEIEDGIFFPYGTCSYFLCLHAPLNEPSIPIFLQKSKNFFLSEDSFEKPLIMIGPGTGVAPFRGFMQERIFKKAHPENWLFFGERTSVHDFYYKADWFEFAARGFLQIDVAFSRDQNEKIYVQHRMQEKSAKVWHWLMRGAYLYVCGDAKEMARDVDKMLHLIVEKEGKLDPLQAKEYIRNLKKQNRYQRDVY